MKKFFYPLLSFVSILFVGAFLSGCTPEENTSLSIEIIDVKATPTSVEFTIKPINAIRYEYSIVKSGNNADMIAIDNGDTQTFKKEDLEEGAIYEIKAVAYGAKDTKSNYKVFTFMASENGGELFYRRVLALKFTGTWCSACPTMTTALNAIKKDDPGRLVTIAVHINDEFSDDIPANRELYNFWNLKALPTTLIDYRDKCEASVTILKESISKSIDEYFASSTVAITSKIEGEKVTINVKAKFVQAGDYKIGCAITENNIERKATSGSRDGLYHSVLRYFLTNALGDELGSIEAGDEISKTYTVDLNKDWNVEELNVAAFIMRKDKNGEYYVNNSAESLINGSVDFS